MSPPLRAALACCADVFCGRRNRTRYREVVSGADGDKFADSLRVGTVREERVTLHQHRLVRRDVHAELNPPARLCTEEGCGDEHNQREEPEVPVALRGGGGCDVVGSIIFHGFFFGLRLR